MAEKQQASNYFLSPFGQIDLNQIEVRVKEKSTNEERTFTYKSFLDLQDRYELIGQVDENGNLIPGDPNLNPRHRKVAVQDQNLAVHAANPGMTMEQKLAMRDELLQKFSPPKIEVKPVIDPPPIEEIKPEPKQRAKPGPKPKQSA